MWKLVFTGEAAIGPERPCQTYRGRAWTSEDQLTTSPIAVLAAQAGQWIFTASGSLSRTVSILDLKFIIEDSLQRITSGFESKMSSFLRRPVDA